MKLIVNFFSRRFILEGSSEILINRFSLGRHIFCGGSSEILINRFSLGRHIFLGGCLRLESSCIQVNTLLKGHFYHYNPINFIHCFLINILPALHNFLSRSGDTWFNF